MSEDQLLQFYGPPVEIREGMSVRAKIPFDPFKPKKIYIDYVLPSKAYSDLTHVVYRVYGTHKQWWHTFICDIHEMRGYINKAKMLKGGSND